MKNLFNELDKLFSTKMNFDCCNDLKILFLSAEQPTYCALNVVNSNVNIEHFAWVWLLISSNPLKMHLNYLIQFLLKGMHNVQVFSFAGTMGSFVTCQFDSCQLFQSSGGFCLVL